MTYDEIFTQVFELLQRDKRVAYRVLKRRFELDDDYLEDLKADLIDAKHVAIDEDGKVLVWGGAGESSAPDTPDAAPSPPPAQPRAPEAERRQLTVEFIDLVGSTTLSGQLDPEELRELVRAYQETCATVISQYDGYIAQYLGDGLLVYFGYPAAHEDDAVRAIRAGLGIVEALSDRNPTLAQPLQVRIGIHTGPVVVGEMGGGGRHEQLALGETPNIAARVQGQAEPNSVVISAATARLVSGLFECQVLGLQALKGVSTPLELYRVQGESVTHSRFEVAVRTGLTPLVGREHELGVLYERWTQAQAGNGQVVLLSGEPGIGKSRLVQELKAQVTQAGETQIEFRCSPYHRNSALYPVTEHLQRLLQFAPNDTPQTKLAKLQRMLGRYRFPQADTLPLLAALLSLPHPEGAPPIGVSPQKQKEITHAALVAWLVEETEQRPVYNSWEDLHWADPSTLEVLDLLLTQVPTSRLLTVLTFRPEFVPSWGTHSYLSHLTLNPLDHPQVSAMVERVTGGKALPEEVMQQIVTKTDGVPLFVEELTKMVLESNLVHAVNSHYELTGPLPPLAIPSTLQDSLMARLDRMAPVKEVAQLGATLGREFSYELLAAVSRLDEVTLQQGLSQLVEAELVYQRGLLPQAHYLFKHALIQDTAYQSLLKSPRQQYHRQIAQVLEEHFTETVETQPELLAHHYTEAGLIEQAIPCWQQAGQRASQRSANVEAIRHLSTGLNLLKTLPTTPALAEQELSLQLALGVPLMATKGWAAPEMQRAYGRALELCHSLDETPQRFAALWGLWAYYAVRGELPRASELGQQMLRFAQRSHDLALLLVAYRALGATDYFLGELASARRYIEHGLRLYDGQQQAELAFVYGEDMGVACLCFAATVLWTLGYPDQAYQKSNEALVLAQELAHPHTLAEALFFAARLHLLRREASVAHELAGRGVAICTEQGLRYWLANNTHLQGCVLAMQGHVSEGIEHMEHGLAAARETGCGLALDERLTLLAEAYETDGHAGKALALLNEALAEVAKTSGRVYAAEVYQRRGELLFNAEHSPIHDERRAQRGRVRHSGEAEAYFQKAIDIARQQEAKSWELRAAMSLARLWQRQGKKEEAHQRLSEIYHWFTEGFDTKDLQEAKELLEALR